MTNTTKGHMAAEKKIEAMTLQTYLEAMKNSFAKMVPKHLSVDRLLKVALNTVSRNSKLKLCTMASVAQCVGTCAELGLEPGGALGEAYLVPFKTWNKEKKQEIYTCTLIIGYRGYVTLMRRSSQLSTIRAVVVHEKDKFRYREGIDTVLEHEPYLEGDPGVMRFVYCVIKLADGGVQVEVMSKSQVDLIRSRSRSADDGPWVTDYEEMSKKTVIRRAAKLAPMSSELAQAIQAEEDFVDGEVVRREGVISLVGGERVQAPQTPSQGPEPLQIPEDDLEEKLKESVEQAKATGETPTPEAPDLSPAAPPPPPVPLSPLDEILQSIDRAAKPIDLNPLASKIGKLPDAADRAKATAAYSTKAKFLRGGAR